jgi:hypothetical protein
MKYCLKILFLVALTLAMSCDEIYYIDCEECFTVEPNECNITLLYQTTLGTPYSAHIDVYLGKVEDGVLIESFELNETSFNPSFRALIDNEYTVVATTIVGNKVYRVINSTIPETKFVEEVCTDDCYVIRKNTINIKLKYY